MCPLCATRNVAASPLHVPGDYAYDIPATYMEHPLDHFKCIRCEMLGEGSILVGTIVGSCLVAVLLAWTGVVYCSARGRWRRLDPLLVGLLVESCLRQGAVASRSALRLFRPAPELSCSAVLWASAGLHCLQAATLATLALSAPLLSRRPRLFTKSHLGYHLVSTALLSSCVGLAAVLSRPDACSPESSDNRYTLFSLALHTSFVFLSLVGLLLHCCSPGRPPVLAGSTSDLSSAVSDVSRNSTEPLRARHYLVAELLLRAKLQAETDPTYMSTTSSTNSRACLARTKPPENVPPITAVAVVLIGLAANHIPVLVLGMSQTLWSGVWRVDDVPEWGAVLEGLLLPIVLALCDRAFLDRVAAVYTSSRPYDLNRPTQGLYGKFRRFGGSMMQQHQEAHTVRFPITNGSLFTTLEGRGCLLRQHNYRRVPPGMFLNLHHHQAQPPQPGGGHHYHSGHPVHQGVVQQGHRHQEVAAGPPLTSVDQLRALLGVAEDGPEEGGHYATLTSLMSACSATTAANDDFEFFHQMSPSTNQNPSHHKEQASCRENGDQVNRERRILDDNKISFRESSVGDIPKERAWRRSLESDGPGRLMPVLSVDSLAAALSKPGVSYLDTGDICTHRSDSVPDLKRIFLTDYL